MANLAARNRQALRIAESLDELPHDAAPPEVEPTLLSLGFPPLREVRRIKVSFHATYILVFDGPVPLTGGKQGCSKAILQLIGSELGDKPLFRVTQPISAELIERATALAREAGVRVPEVLAIGEAEEFGPFQRLPFVVYEFIETATVEDEVRAPEAQWRAIVQDIQRRLAARSLQGVDTGPLPRFDDFGAYVAYLADLARASGPGGDALAQAAERIGDSMRQQGIQPVPPTLIHQDLNGGNVLCSPDPISGAWGLDALIDWEGVAVADARLAYDRGEPWSSLRKLANLIKVRWLATTAATGDREVPRCQAEELIEEYAEMKEDLVASKVLGSSESAQLAALPNFI